MQCSMKVLRGCFGFVAVLGLWFRDKACHTLWWSFFRLNTVIWHRRPVRDTWHWQQCDQDTWQGCDQSAWHPWTLLSCNWPGHHSCHEAVISRVQGSVQCSVAALDCISCSGCLQRPASPARGLVLVLVLVLVWRWCNSPAATSPVRLQQWGGTGGGGTCAVRRQCTCSGASASADTGARVHTSDKSIAGRLMSYCPV